MQSLLRRVVSRAIGTTPSCSLANSADTIQRLKELERRIDFSALSRPRPADPTVVDLLVEVGVAEARWLYDDEGVSCARTILRDGAYLPDHTHDQTEAWVVYRGYLEVIVDGERVDRPGKIAYYVHPGSVHSVRAVGDTEVIVIAVPRSDSFPRGPAATSD